MMINDNSNWYKEPTIREILLTGPPGCGKSRKIAEWIKEIVECGKIKWPRKALVLTFSKKAKENLYANLREQLGPGWNKWVSLYNFHGWACHLYEYHCSWLKLKPRNLGVEESYIQQLEKSVLKSYNATNRESYAKNKNTFHKALRESKVGAFTEKRVINNLARITDIELQNALVKYEDKLRHDGKVDHNDKLRLGLLILEDKRVIEYYGQKFSLIAVDEVQDLSLQQLNLVSPIGLKKTLWSGDEIQGIYTFAGANPKEVFEYIIENRNPDPIPLTTSYRSGDSVLRVANALRAELGDQNTYTADQNLPLGTVFTLHSRNRSQEAECLIKKIIKWQEDSPSASIGVIAKQWELLDEIKNEAQQRDMRPIIWDIDTFDNNILEAVYKHAKAMGNLCSDINVFEERCKKEFILNNTASESELAEIFDQIKKLMNLGNSLVSVIDMIYDTSKRKEPVGPGLHLLSGHAGKGQEFDNVIILGLEEGIMPHKTATTLEEFRGELAVLYVMVTRARKELLISSCNNIDAPASKSGEWMRLIEEHIDVKNKICLYDENCPYGC